ncbi:hypothetical protein [Nonomuraea guangzhouensis]|uniref:Tetratricopeptide repeat protein n=1 Tax=Nonomuraea guangzhouensis TaxID=1291555 RepID=A0ABW4GQF6_9ACTN|nr:hypothetical protein [Nonomuraea guangzhouensis]
MEALTGWLATPTWEESARFLAGHPILLTDAGELALAREIPRETEPTSLTGLEEHAMLLQQARRHGVEATFTEWARRREEITQASALEESATARYGAGDATALDELVQARARISELMVDIRSRHQAALVEEAHALCERHRLTRHDDDLGRAVECLRSAFRPPMTASPKWVTVVTDVVGLLAHRGSIAALDLAQTLVSRALNVTAPDSAAVPTLLSLSGRVLRIRWECGGTRNDLGHAVSLLDRAVDTDRAAAFHHLPRSLENLAIVLLERYREYREKPDLDRSVALLSELEDLLPRRSPQRSTVLTNLAGALLLRADAGSVDEERADDLDRAFELTGEVLASLPPGSPAAATVHGTLANAWLSRYDTGHELIQLDRAVEHGERAVAAAVPGSRDRPAHLVSLARALLKRARRLANNEDYDRAVSLYRTATEETFPQSPSFKERRSGFGTALLTRYLHSGAEQDLHEAMSQLTEIPATEATAPSVRDTELLYDAGNGQWIRYRRTRDLSCLERAIALLEMAAADISADSVHRAQCVNSLAGVLTEHFIRTRDVSSLRDAVAYFREAMDGADSSSERLDYVANLGNALRLLSGATPDGEGLDEAVTLLRSALGLVPEYAAQRGPLLTNLAAALIVAGGQAELEEAELHLRAALELTATGSPDRPVQLANLGRVLIRLHGHTGQQHHLDEGVQVLRHACQLGLKADPDVTLGVCRPWGGWAEHRGEHAEAAEAFSWGMRAAHQLFQAQLLRSHRENWLGSTADVHVRAAWNHLARSPQHRGDAVLALERGRALLLSESLRFRDSALDALAEGPHRDLAERFGRAVARVAELSALDR